MTTESQQYELSILLDRNQVDTKTLEEESRRVLRDYLGRVQLTVGLARSQHPLLSLSGSLEDIDACHRELYKVMILKRGWNNYRLRDTTGDEVRKRAYPILADMEQELRAFINECVIEVFGFEGWQSPSIMSSSALKNVSGLTLTDQTHPLERTLFDDLVQFVTTEVSEWDVDRALTPADLISLLSQSADLEQLKATLAKKTGRFSLWDNVFSKYFDDDEKWHAAQAELKAVVECRNKVMHHRPMYLGELKAIEAKCRNIKQLLVAQKRHLTEQERNEIQQHSGGLREVYATIVRGKDTDEQFRELWQEIDQSDDVDNVLKVVRSLDKYVNQSALTLKPVYQLRVIAFRHLKELTVSNASTAQPIILHDLLPLCLQESSETPVEISDMRECLDAWVNQYDDITRSNLIAKVYEVLIPETQSSSLDTVCWTIQHIGFRTQQLADALWDAIQRCDDESGDVALATLVRLGAQHEDSNRITQELHRRMSARCNIPLIDASARHADSLSIQQMLLQWLSKANPDPANFETALIFNAVGDILDAHTSDGELQDQTWADIAKFVESGPSNALWHFETDQVTTHCNSSLVIPTIFRFMGERVDATPKPAWTRYLLGQRLADCVMPRQLAGWSQIEADVAFDKLKAEVCRNTGSDGFFQTSELMQKQEAWRTLLRAGYADALLWFDPAVTDETSRFEQQKVMELLACFRLPTLPKEAARWVTERYDVQGGQIDGRDHARRLAALRLVCSSETIEALDTLLNFGYTLDGQPFIATSEIVTELACYLVHQGAPNVARRLVECILRSPHYHQRLVASVALQYIVAATSAEVVSYTSQLCDLLREQDRQPLEKAGLLGVLSGFESFTFPEDLVTKIRVWAREPEHTLSHVCLYILAKQGVLERDESLLHDVLGLEHTETGWAVASAVRMVEWAPQTIGHLYSLSPQPFIHSVATLLETGDQSCMIQLTHWLCKVHGESGKPPVPREIEDALFARLRRRQTAFSGETDLLEVLVRLAPQSFIAEPWSNTSANWMPDVLVALSNALGTIDVHGEQLDMAIHHLQYLAASNTYAVRRAAYRSIARKSMETLYGICKSWLEASSYRMAKWAAEACGWIDEETGPSGEDRFNELYQLLASHPEKDVRETLDRSRKERRNRAWAKQYLDKVVSVRGDTNQEVLDAWCYGDALARVGDDDCIEALQEDKLPHPIHPHVRHWLNLIQEELKRNWSKATEKWPEPWHFMEGALEQGRGVLHLSDSKAVEVQYSIWQQTDVTAQASHSWGGVLTASEMFLRLEGSIIELQDGRKGKLIMTHTSNNVANFVGNGPYPV